MWSIRKTEHENKTSCEKQKQVHRSSSAVSLLLLKQHQRPLAAHDLQLDTHTLKLA